MSNQKMLSEKHKYSIPPEEVFIEKVYFFFNVLIDRSGYELAEVIHKNRSAKVIYVNPEINRRIEIINQTNHTDYGFSIFIYNTMNDEYNIAANIPSEREDKECNFVERSALFFFKSLASQISGEEWNAFGHILHQE